MRGRSQNTEDVINLEVPMVMVYNMTQTPFAHLTLDMPTQVPFRADAETLDNLGGYR